MKALVLGGSRFIGLRLVWLLHGQGHEVTVLNRGQTRAELPDGVTRLYVDRTDARKVKDLLKDADYDVAFDISAYTTATLNPGHRGVGGQDRALRLLQHHLGLSSCRCCSHTRGLSSLPQSGGQKVRRRQGRVRRPADGCVRKEGLSGHYSEASLRLWAARLHQRKGVQLLRPPDSNAKNHHPRRRPRFDSLPCTLTIWPVLLPPFRAGTMLSDRPILYAAPTPLPPTGTSA